MPGARSRGPRPLHADASATRRLLARNIRRARLAADLSQDDVAVRMRSVGHPTWSRTTVSELERAGRGLDVDELVRLCQVVDSTPRDLMEPGDETPIDVQPAAWRAFWEGRLRMAITFGDDGLPSGWNVSPTSRGSAFESLADALEGTPGAIVRRRDA